MSELKRIVDIVLEQQKTQLSSSTFEVRKRYLLDLAVHGNSLGIFEPCQKLYDSYVARAETPDLRFQLFHAVRLVDKEAGTKASTPEGKLYNEPELPSSLAAEVFFSERSFPIKDDEIDAGYLIRRAESEMDYLHLTPSTLGQYLKAWREFYISLYLNGDTSFNREACRLFIESTDERLRDGQMHVWKWKIRRRSVNVLLEVADTGCFKWKLFRRKKICCQENTLEKLRQQYLSFIRSRNLENTTVSLHDYAFRCLVDGIGVRNASELSDVGASHIQTMLTSLSKRLCLNSRGTVYPILRQVLSYLYISGFMSNNFSGMILTPAYQNKHLRPYLNAGDEEKMFAVMEEAPFRTKAMMRLAIRLGLRDIDICSLQFSQIDWQNDMIVLKQEKTGVTLSLPLLEDVGNSIMDYIMKERPAAAKGYPYIFVRAQAPYTKLTSMYGICSDIFGKADVKTENCDSRGVHVCRYTLVHKLLLKKVPHQVITDTLGHVSKESDKPYISMEEQMLRECPLDFSLIGQKYWKEGDAYV